MAKGKMTKDKQYNGQRKNDKRTNNIIAKGKTTKEQKNIMAKGKTTKGQTI
jgi:hypothetical protein